MLLGNSVEKLVGTDGRVGKLGRLGRLGRLGKENPVLDPNVGRVGRVGKENPVLVDPTVEEKVLGRIP